jgi:uncharacterized membrane protein
MTYILMNVGVLALGLTGFFIALYIYKHKKANTQPMVCPLDFDCHAVVHSDYSRFLGIRVEVLGMIYYGYVVLAYVLILGYQNGLVSSNSILTFPIYFLSPLAFAFSIYLVSVQAFVLKNWCTWCIISAAISTLIFLRTLFIVLGGF